MSQILSFKISLTFFLQYFFYFISKRGEQVAGGRGVAGSKQFRLHLLQQSIWVKKIEFGTRIKMEEIF